MAQVVVMPQLGNTVESCLIVAWQVAEGDTIATGDNLCEVETDKATMDVESTASGTVLRLLWTQGDEVPVKQAIAVIGQAGEDYNAALQEAGLSQPSTNSTLAEAVGPAAAAPVTTSNSPSDAANGTVHSATNGETNAVITGAASPRAKALATAQGLDFRDAGPGTGPGGRIIARDIEHALLNGPGYTAGARQQAAVTPGASGQGLGGRVTTADLTTGMISKDVGTAPVADDTAVALTADFPGAYTDTPLKSVRKIIAERMMHSLTSTAQVSYQITAPADGLLSLRSRFKAADSSLGLGAITIGDLVAYSATQAILRHPALNSHLENQAIRTFDHVHLGLAVDTPRGLLVPTIRYASTLGLRALSQATKQLGVAANDGSIAPELLSGATFTVTNLGAFGVEAFTPVLNTPQSAILGVGAIRPHAVVKADGSLGVEQRINLSLTADHQVVDGADAARFLQDLCQIITHIDLAVIS